MTATEARLITLKEVIDFCKEEQTKCEGEDRWVVIGNKGRGDSRHWYPHETEVKIIETTENYKLCDASNNYQWVHIDDLENRKHLNTDRYNALQDVIDKCEKLMNAIKITQ